MSDTRTYIVPDG
jgi:hypothetical protein